MSESYIDVATTADAQTIMLLPGMLFKHKVEFYTDYDRQHRAKMGIISQLQQGRFLPLKINETIMGVVSLLYLSSTAVSDKVAILKELIIHPDHKGDSLRKNLLAAMTGFAKQQGCSRLSLLTDKPNRRAPLLYQQQSFSVSAALPLRLGF